MKITQLTKGMLDIDKIGYQSELDQEYAKRLAKIKTLKELKEMLFYWYPLASDAYELVEKFDDERFKKLLRAMSKERSGIFSDSDDAAIILMPEVMFKVSMVASQFKAPWGLAFRRLNECEKMDIKQKKVTVNI